jgi:uncharacterized coiled-coil protein SlyX
MTRFISMHAPLQRAGLAGLTLALMSQLVLAQTAPAAPANGKLQSLGSATAKAPIMSRDELRACLREQSEFKTRSADMASQRLTLDVERKALEQDNDALRKERDALASRVERTVNEINARVAAHTDTVKKFNDQMETLNAAVKKGENVDRRRAVLEREGAQLQKTSDELNATNAAAQAEIDAAQKSLTSRFAVIETRVADWNVRNRKMEPVAALYDDDMSSWKTRCGGRNYRESDEQAIRAGK